MRHILAAAYHTIQKIVFLMLKSFLQDLYVYKSWVPKDDVPRKLKISLHKKNHLRTQKN